MKLKLLLMMLITMTVNAKSVPIELTGYTSYPSPASSHLDNLQHDLAAKAVEACGGVENVDSIANISIDLSNGVYENDGVANIESGEFGMMSLNLWYPKISATAMAICK